MPDLVNSHHRSRLLWIPLAALTLTWALSFSPLYQRLDALALDAQTRLTAPPHYFQDALVIDIDDASLRALQPNFGSWPYQRGTFALLLDYLGEMGVRAVVFDILFADPRQQDAQLRDAIARNRHVVLAATARGETGESESNSSTSSPSALQGLDWVAPAGLSASTWPAIQAPLSVFTQPATDYAGIGVASVVTDRDGILRRLPLFHQSDNRYFPNLALAAHFAGAPHPAILTSTPGNIQIGKFSWPMDREGAVHLYYPRNSNSILSMPFSRVAQAMLGMPGQELDPNLLRDKTVFVGSSAFFSDRVLTPVGEMSGLYLTAVAHQSLAQNLLLTPPHWQWNTLLLLIALAPTLLLLWQPRRSALAGTAISAGAALAVYASHLALLHWLRQESSLLQPFLVILLANLMETIRALRHLNAAQKARIHVLANNDPLTRLPNRFSLHAQLAHAIAGAQMTQSKLAVLLIDFDDFKSINDTLGHEIGDDMLLEATNRLKASVRTNDIIARMGGDEFGVVVGGVEQATAVQCAEKILGALAQPYLLAGQKLHITSSIGISLFPNDGGDVASLLKNADTAMYRAKAQGRNSYCLFTPELGHAAMDRLLLENQLHQALARQEFVLHYQPQINMQTGCMVAVEALVRWNHPQHGMLYPDHFIPAAENSGLILPLGEWVLRTACQQLQAWHAAGLTHIERIAVNLSARQFELPTLPALVANVLKETQLLPKHLELEITESVAMRNPQRSIEILNTLRSMGITLALDDFGTGHSSLTYLKLFPITSLKIDSSFVRDIETDQQDAEICKATIALAHKLGLTVVAEGVEKFGQLQFLRNIECGEAQGYLFSQPLPATELANFIPAPASN